MGAMPSRVLKQNDSGFINGKKQPSRLLFALSKQLDELLFPISVFSKRLTRNRLKYRPSYACVINML